jgi:hypothetical protein
MTRHGISCGKANRVHIEGRSAFRASARPAWTTSDQDTYLYKRTTEMFAIGSTSAENVHHLAAEVGISKPNASLQENLMHKT